MLDNPDLSAPSLIPWPVDGDREAGTRFELIIPALNEAQRIGATLLAIVEHLERLPFSCAVTVVDNGSADATADVVKALANTSVKVRLIGCRQRGKGAAVKAGILSSDARWVGFCDADLATPIATLDEVLPLLDTGAQVVIGSRRCGGASYTNTQPPLRRLGSWGFRRMTRSLAGDFSDTQCGFKFFERSAAQKIFRQVTSAGFTFDLEVMAAAKRLGIPVAEIPVEWTDKPGSTLRPIEHGFQILREVRSLRALAAVSPSNDRGVVEKV